MANRDNLPTWFLWIVEHLHIIFGFGLVALALFFGAIYTMDSRLSDIEEQLNFEPPRSYTPPNLDEYDAGDTKASQLIQQQVVYVPVYSHIYYQGGAAYSLEATLSIRNVDIQRPIYIKSVEYYDTDGKLTKTPIDRLIKLMPLQTIEFLIERRDSTGGSGANFLVRWGSKTDVNKPLIETVMVGTSGTQGISFGRTGIELSVNDESVEPSVPPANVP